MATLEQLLDTRRSCRHGQMAETGQLKRVRRETCAVDYRKEGASGICRGVNTKTGCGPKNDKADE